MHLKVTALARKVGAIGVFERQQFSVVLPDSVSRDEITMGVIREIRNQGYEIEALVRVMPEDA